MIRATATEYQSRPILRPVQGQRGIMYYDQDNLYPQRIWDNVANSPFGSAAIRKASEAFYGLGFVAGGDVVVNAKGQTANDVLFASAEDYALYGGFALHLQFNDAGQVAGVAQIPFKFCRLKKPDTNGISYEVAVWDNWDSTNNAPYRARAPRFYPVYGPPNTFAAQVAELGGDAQSHPGQVLYFGDRGLTQYPVAPIDPAIYAVQVDAAIRTFQMRNMRTGFMPSHYAVIPFEFQSEHDRAQFKANLEAFQGAAESGKIMLLENPTDRPVEIKLAEQHEWDSKFVVTEESVQNAIFYTLSQPPAVHGVDRSGNLSRAQLAEAWSVYNINTTRQRGMLSRAFARVFDRFDIPGIDTTIQPLVIA